MKPPAALLDQIARMKPVRTRVPWRSFAVVAALSLGYAAAWIVGTRLRPDLPWLPRAWVGAIGAAWLAGFALPLGAALVPRRGQVLPDGDRAARVAAAAAIALIALSALFPYEAIGHSLSSSGAALWPSVARCFSFALVAQLVPFGIALGFARRLMPVGAWRLGAALGASAGALIGLVLHLLCPFGSALHLALGHGGGVVGCALLGALIAPRVVKH